MTEVPSCPSCPACTALSHLRYEQAHADGESSGYADWVIAFENTNIEFPDRVNMWAPTEVAQWIEAEMMRNR